MEARSTVTRERGAAAGDVAAALDHRPDRRGERPEGRHALPAEVHHGARRARRRERRAGPLPDPREVRRGALRPRRVHRKIVDFPRLVAAAPRNLHVDEQRRLEHERPGGAAPRREASSDNVFTPPRGTQFASFVKNTRSAATAGSSPPSSAAPRRRTATHR